MPSTYDSLLRLEIQAVGENANTWGTKTNTNLNLLAAAIAGHVSVSVPASGNYTLTTQNAASDEARSAIISLNGTLSGNVNILVPESSKTYIIVNNVSSASYAITVKTATGSGAALNNSVASLVVCTGVTCIDLLGSIEDRLAALVATPIRVLE